MSPPAITTGPPDQGLGDGDLGENPVEALRTWLDEARTAGQLQPEAMALATTSCHVPSVRMVLLRGLDDGGLRFYTNRESRKGKELRHNPRAAVCFHWTLPRPRQVRVEGRTAELSAAESAAYFASRDPRSRISAWASPQSRPVSDRDEIDRLWKAARAAHPDDDAISLPPSWGGYRLVPERIEFWQSQRDRLHDRIEFSSTGAAWTQARLAP